MDLLNRLRTSRADDAMKHLPLIFVCHSMGGIVVKKVICVSLGTALGPILTTNQALILAHEIDNQYGEILSSCIGTVFMATPHRGSSLAS